MVFDFCASIEVDMGDTGEYNLFAMENYLQDFSLCGRTAAAP